MVARAAVRSDLSSRIQHGTTTTDVSGRGVGMDVVAASSSGSGHSSRAIGDRSRHRDHVEPAVVLALLRVVLLEAGEELFACRQLPCGASSSRYERRRSASAGAGRRNRRRNGSADAAVDTAACPGRAALAKTDGSRAEASDGRFGVAWRRCTKSRSWSSRS